MGFHMRSQPHTTAALALLLATTCMAGCPTGAGLTVVEPDASPNLTRCGDAECTDDELCVDDVCLPACDDDAQCDGGCDLELGVCVPCTSDDHCGPHEQCVNQQCTFYCRGEDACDDDETCIDGVCVGRECETRTDCAPMQNCVDFSCVDVVNTLICAPGAAGCDGSDLVTCNADGTERTLTPCAAGCVQDDTGAACLDDGCAPNTAGCLGTDVAVTCDADGTETRTTCGDAQQCVQGACADPVAPLSATITWSSEVANVDLVFGRRFICDDGRLDWAHPTPNWGSPAVGPEDPVFDVVDDEGLGPETLQWQQPTDGDYALGVHLAGPLDGHALVELVVHQGDTDLMNWTIPMGTGDLFVAPMRVDDHVVSIDFMQLYLVGAFDECASSCGDCASGEQCPTTTASCVGTPASARYCDSDADCDDGETCNVVCESL